MIAAMGDDSGRIAPRPPQRVMRLARMGAAHQTRLSFMRILLRRMMRDNWRFERPVFDIGADGVGHAVYTAYGPERCYSLVAFAHDLPDEARSDRVIAEAWDATFTLFDGLPDDADIERLRANVPLQEAGRITQSELSLSRANRSTRLFAHVVERLSQGLQPDAEMVAAVGYLMRTTAVYGSGKFGAADRECIARRAEFSAPFQVEMLSVYLTRCFVMDLVEHLARARAPQSAVRMDPAIKRSFSIGNSTGLGMAPFLVNHPRLLNNWIAAREEALARVRNLPQATEAEVAVFRAVLRRAIENAGLWTSQHPLQIEKLDALRGDLSRLSAHATPERLAQKRPWDALYRWAEDHLGFEGQEQLVALLLEPYGDLVDDLGETMSADEEECFAINGAMPVGRLKQILGDVYDWAGQIDWSSRAANARAWYVSQEKLEPRLGERFDEPIEDYEQPLAPGRDAARLSAALSGWDDDRPVAEFLLASPEHRHIVRRAQIAARFRYAEIRDNTIDHAMLPIDMLRCKLAFFGAGRFDPRSDRWVRINMFAGAPFPEELADWTDEAWAYGAEQ